MPTKEIKQNHKSIICRKVGKEGNSEERRQIENKCQKDLFKPDNIQISIITLKVSGQNIMMKRQRLSDGIKELRLNYMLSLKKFILKIKTQIKKEGMEKINNVNIYI